MYLMVMIKIVMIENIIKTVNSSQEEKKTDIHIWEKTSGRFRKWANILIILCMSVEYNIITKYITSWYEISTIDITILYSL